MKKKFTEEQIAYALKQACEVMLLGRSTYRYRSITDGQEALTMRIREIAAVRVRDGYKRIHVLLRREGWQVNHKRVYRIYCKEGLNLGRKQIRRRAGASLRLVRQNAQNLNDCWTMDFASDGLFNGRRFRVLSVLDIFSRECLGIEVNQGIKGQDVVTLLDQITSVRGIPRSIRCDNGPEFVSKVLDRWAYENRVCVDFSRPGKPTDNALAESFIGSLRDECLNVNWFLSLEDARHKIEAWRVDYNEYRPHSSLGYKTPSDYKRSGLFEAGKLTV